MTKWSVRRLLPLLCLLLAGAAHAEQLFMARSQQAFPEAMLTLQSAITEHGYKVTRVQRVDIGLTGSGFKTDKYRVVFFGKPQEVRELTARYPQLIPYLPWPVTIFAEGDQTLVVTANPEALQALQTNAELRKVFRHWTDDLRAIMDEVRNTTQ